MGTFSLTFSCSILISGQCDLRLRSYRAIEHIMDMGRSGSRTINIVPELELQLYLGDLAASLGFPHIACTEDGDSVISKPII